MFVKINRVNSHEETKELVFNTDDVLRLTGVHTEDKQLFDENNNPVQTIKAQPRYHVIMRDGKTYTLDQTNYDILVKELVK